MNGHSERYNFTARAIGEAKVVTNCIVQFEVYAPIFGWDADNVSCRFTSKYKERFGESEAMGTEVIEMVHGNNDIMMRAS